MTEIQEGSKVARVELVELVETVREALCELYGQGDVRFNGVTPKRGGNEALDELYRRCDSLMVRAGLAETYIPAARYDAYKTRLRLLLSSEDESAREGMVSVVDYEGRVVGSMGVEPWQSILSSEDETRPTPEGHGRTGSNHLGNPDVGPLPRWDATRPTGDEQ